MRAKVRILEDLHKLEDNNEIKSGFIHAGDSKYIRVYWLSWYDKPLGVMIKRD